MQSSHLLIFFRSIIIIPYINYIIVVNPRSKKKGMKSAGVNTSKKSVLLSWHGNKP